MRLTFAFALLIAVAALHLTGCRPDWNAILLANCEVMRDTTRPAEDRALARQAILALGELNFEMTDAAQRCLLDALDLPPRVTDIPQTVN